MIPKIIHYVWVGDSEKNELTLRCIESWKKYLPDYEIREWNNSSMSMIDNVYACQAFENKRWAFVSDYLRLHALQEFGGFYFDTDLEITASLEPFRKDTLVFGFELYKGEVSPVTALIGAKPNNRVIKEILSLYDDLSFINEDGTFNLNTNTRLITDFIKNKYDVSPPFDPSNKLVLGDELTIYPSFFFCTPEAEQENYAVHHFNGSWLSGYRRKGQINLFGLSFLRLKRNSNFTEILPLNSGERSLLHVRITKKYSFAMLKVDR